MVTKKKKLFYTDEQLTLTALCAVNNVQCCKKEGNKNKEGVREGKERNPLKLHGSVPFSLY